MAYGSIGTIWAEVGLNTRKLDEGLMQAQIKLANADKTISTFGQKLSLNSTKLITAGGLMAGAVTAVGVATVKMAADFEKSMRNVNSIAKLSEKEFANMSGEVIDLSKKLPQSAKTLADGLYDISSSGFAGADGLKVLEAAAKAASAGITDTATSAKGITAVLNAYGLEAEDASAISDTMFKTVDKGVITFEELSSSIGDVVGTANLADINFNELSGALAYLTTKGIGAAEATTSLNRLILSIIKPSEELALALQNAGYESGEAAIKQLGLVGVLELMEKASGGSLTKLQELSPEMRALKASGALLGNGIQDLNAYMNEFKDTTGATQIALEEQSKSLDFQLKLLKNNISAISITLGSELIPSVTDTVSKLTEWITTNDDLTVNLIKVGGGITAIMSSILLLGGALGKLRVFLMTAGGAMSLAIAAPIAFVTAMDQLSDMVENKFIKAILEGLSPMHTMVESFQRLSVAMKEYKDGNVSFIEALFMSRDEVESLQGSVKSLNDGMQGYDKYMEKGTSSTKDLTGGVNELGEEIEDTTQELNNFIESLFNLYNINQSVTEATWAYEDAQKLLNEAIAEYGEGSREVQEAIFGVQDAREELLQSIREEYQAEGTTLDRKKELERQYIRLAREAVASGEITQQTFVDILNEFNNTVKGVQSGVAQIGKALDSIPRKITVEVDVKYNQGILSLDNAPPKPPPLKAMGGIVGMPQAATGMVVPQTGRTIPVLAHEGEIIANTSQQRNLAEWIMGKANSKPEGGANVPIEIRIPIELDGRVIAETSASFIYDGTQTKLRLGG